MFDISRLKKYARRAAQELGGNGRWLLDVRNSFTRSKMGRGDYGDEHYDVSYHLQQNGDLITEGHAYYNGIQSGSFFSGSNTTDTRPMTEGEMLSFDRVGNKPNDRIWAREKV